MVFVYVLAICLRILFAISFGITCVGALKNFQTEKDLVGKGITLVFAVTFGGIAVAFISALFYLIPEVYRLSNVEVTESDVTCRSVEFKTVIKTINDGFSSHETEDFFTVIILEEMLERKIAFPGTLPYLPGAKLKLAQQKYKDEILSETIHPR